MFKSWRFLVYYVYIPDGLLLFCLLPRDIPSTPRLPTPLFFRFYPLLIYQPRICMTIPSFGSRSCVSGTAIVYLRFFSVFPVHCSHLTLAAMSRCPYAPRSSYWARKRLISIVEYMWRHLSVFGDVVWLMKRAERRPIFIFGCGRDDMAEAQEARVFRFNCLFEGKIKLLVTQEWRDSGRRSGSKFVPKGRS